MPSLLAMVLPVEVVCLRAVPVGPFQTSLFCAGNLGQLKFCPLAFLLGKMASALLLQGLPPSFLSRAWALPRHRAVRIRAVPVGPFRTDPQHFLCLHLEAKSFMLPLNLSIRVLSHSAAGTRTQARISLLRSGRRGLRMGSASFSLALPLPINLKQRTAALYALSRLSLRSKAVPVDPWLDYGFLPLPLSSVPHVLQFQAGGSPLQSLTAFTTTFCLSRRSPMIARG